jgi:succinoglycan biosynthesis transport protein ExoP
MYDVVPAMREDITLDVNETQRGKWGEILISSFEISYEGQDPTKVMHVTNAIANLVIEDNIKQRENQAAGTLNFLEREIERTKEQLRLKEKQIRQFKEKHRGRLPEQMANNRRMLEQLENRLNSVNTTIQGIENRKVHLQTELAKLTMGQAGTSQAQGFTGQTSVSLEEARYALGVLRTRYSEQHPDVVRLAATVARLEKEQEASTPNTGPTTPGVTSARSVGESTMGMQTETPRTELGLINKQLATLAEEKRKLMTKIQIYEWRIQNGPVIEQKYVDLRRGYEEADQNYQSLLSNKLHAELAENLELTQKGEQFVILRPANLPQMPFKPQVGPILILGLALALACGIGLPVLRESMDQTFWNKEDLEKVVGLPVLISIPVVNTPSERLKKLFKRVGTLGALVSMAFVLIYALILLRTMTMVQLAPGG